MDWKRPWLPIFRETFEGVQPGADGTYFVQGSEAFMPIVDKLSAEQASHRFGGSVNSIAAHTRHTAYYISLLNAVADGEPVNPDWESTWSIQEVDAQQWTEIREELRSQYLELIQNVESGKVPADDDQMTYTTMQLAHAAFHLGSVRQLAMML